MQFFYTSRGMLLQIEQLLIFENILDAEEMFVLKDKRFLENSYYYLDGVIFLIEPLLDYFQFVCEFVLSIGIRWHGTQSSWISIRLICDVILVEFEARVVQNFAPKRSYVRLKVVFEV